MEARWVVIFRRTDSAEALATMGPYRFKWQAKRHAARYTASPSFQAEVRKLPHRIYG